MARAHPPHTTPTPPGVRHSALPRELPVQLATLVSEAPAGDDWLHELKFDGFRILARVQDRRAQLWTRNGKNWTERFPTVAAAIDRLGLQNGLLDGEVVVQLPDGTTSFQALQNAGSSRERGELLYYVFDLLHLNGLDYRRVAQEARKATLQALLSGVTSTDVMRYSDHVIGAGPRFFQQACAARAEGIISKRRDGRYRGGRTRDWLKVKCLQEQEFVVTGFTEPGGSRQGLGALLLGAFEGRELRYCGKVGTGFSAEALRFLRRRLERLELEVPALRNPPRGAEARGVHWVSPEVVVQVSFTEMTTDGILRHPSFRGVREDKAAEDVRLERPEDSKGVRPRSGGGAVATRKKGSGRSVKGAGAVPGPGRGGKREVVVAGVKLSSPEKVMYPGEGVTKLDVARYYESVARWLVPHIANRPLTLVRCPRGYDHECFFQKHMDEVDSPHVRKIRVKETRAARDYGTIRNLAGILTVVQLGALELHTWNSRADRLEYPDRVTLDIDPDPSVGWEDVVQAALEIRLVLAELELESFLKTTGGKGLHVVVPLVRRSGWEEVRDFARAVLATVAAARPDRYTLNLSKARRRGRLLLDYLRNTRGATAVEVYSTRAREGATVSTPVSWEELEAGIDPHAFTIHSVPARLESGIDPWKGYGAVKQSLTAPLKRRLGL